MIDRKKNPTHNIRTLLFSLLGISLCMTCQGCMGLSEQEQLALDGYKRNSKSFIMQKDYGRAIDQCFKGLDIEDEDFSLNLTLAYSLLSLGDKTHVFEAYKQFEKTEDLLWFSDDFRISLGMGQTCFKIATFYRNKLMQYEWKIKKDPESEELYEEEMEQCREGMTDYLSEALDNLHAVIVDERQKENTEAILALGQAYSYLGEEDKALQYINMGLDLLEERSSFTQKTIDTNPTLNDEWLRHFENDIRKNMRMEQELRGVLAFIYSRREDWELALEQYNLMQSRDIFDPIQFYNRGVAYQAMEKYDDAIKDFNQFLRKASPDKNFEEDEHFHRAFDKIKECEKIITSR